MDVLLNNAGVSSRGTALDTDVTTLKHILGKHRSHTYTYFLYIYIHISAEILVTHIQSYLCRR